MRRVLPLVLVVAACYEVPTVPPTPSDLAIVSGAGQSGIPGYRLANQVTVKLLDTDGRPVVGDTVRFEPSDETARAEPEFAISDSSGLASTWWRLGGTLGTQSLSARVNTVPAVSSATVSSTAQSNYVTSIDGGTRGLCGVDTQGRLACWLPPKLGAAQTVARFVPVATPTMFSQVTIPIAGSGTPQGCALAQNGRLWCFTLDAQANVVGLAELSGLYPALTQIVSANEIASYCGLTALGEAWCWGMNGEGQLGDGTRAAHASPQAVQTNARFVQLDMDNHVCAVTAGGEAWCWGANDSQQVGAPAAFSVNVPLQVVTPLRFTKVRVDEYQKASCGFGLDGEVYCWGNTRYYGESLRSAVPTAIPALIVTSARPVDMMVISGAHFLFNSNATMQYSGELSGSLGYSDQLATHLFMARLPNLLSDVRIFQGWQFICGTAILGGSTLCPSTQGLYAQTLWFPATLPPVVGVPFP